MRVRHSIATLALNLWIVPLESPLGRTVLSGGAFEETNVSEHERFSGQKIEEMKNAGRFLGVPASAAPASTAPAANDDDDDDQSAQEDDDDVDNET